MLVLSDMFYGNVSFINIYIYIHVIVLFHNVYRREKYGEQSTSSL